MKHLFLVSALILFTMMLKAQQLDSIPFKGGKFFYHVYGKGEPVIILTGGPGISYQQQEEVAIQVGKKCQAILPEQRGTGRSMPDIMNKETINMDMVTNDLSLLLDHLHVKEATFYGHSYGSLLAVYYGCKHPDRVKQLILAGPAPFNYLGEQMNTYACNKESRFGLSDLKSLDDLDEKAGKGLMTRQDSIWYKKLNNSTIIYDKANMDKIFSKISTGQFNSTTMTLMSTSYSKLNLTDDIKRLHKPITIICGRQDPLAFMAYEYQLIKPEVKLYWIQKSGHFAMFEQPEPFYKALMETLEGTR